MRTWLVEQTSWKGARYEDVRVLFARRSGGVDRAAAGLSARGRRAVAARRSAGAPGCAPAGHSGAGHGHPPSSVPHVTADETGYLGKRRGGARSARPPAGRGRVGTWESGILRTCLPSTLVRIAFSSFAAMPVKLSMSAQRSIT